MGGKCGVVANYAAPGLVGWPVDRGQPFLRVGLARVFSTCTHLIFISSLVHLSSPVQVGFIVSLDFFNFGGHSERPLDECIGIWPASLCQPRKKNKIIDGNFKGIPSWKVGKFVMFGIVV
jgi:hypothetical protein